MSSGCLARASAGSAEGWDESGGGESEEVCWCLVFGDGQAAGDDLTRLNRSESMDRRTLRRWEHRV